MKNKWVWDWLLEKVINGDYLFEYVKQVFQPGLAIYSSRNNFLNSGSSEKKRRLKQAVQCEKKTQKLRT